jgi:hypothetical protein
MHTGAASINDERHSEKGEGPVVQWVVEDGLPGFAQRLCREGTGSRRDARDEAQNKGQADQFIAGPYFVEAVDLGGILVGCLENHGGNESP